jgi:hypothetical protein
MHFSRWWVPCAFMSIAVCDCAVVILASAFGGSLVGDTSSFKLVSVGGRNFDATGVVAALFMAALIALLNCVVSAAQFNWRCRYWVRWGTVVLIAITGSSLFVVLLNWLVSQSLGARGMETTVVGLPVAWQLTAMLGLICLLGRASFLASFGVAIRAVDTGDVISAPQLRSVHSIQQFAASTSTSTQTPTDFDPARLSAERTGKLSLSPAPGYSPTGIPAPSASAAFASNSMRFLLGGAGARGPPSNSELIGSIGRT